MLHIDARRAAAPLALLFDQPSALQFMQQLTGFLLAAAQVGLYGRDRKEEIDAAMLVQPALLHGKIHPVQQKPVEQLGVGRNRTVLRVCDQGLGDAIEGVFNGVPLGEIVIQSIVLLCNRHHMPSFPIPFLPRSLTAAYRPIGMLMSSHTSPGSYPIGRLFGFQGTNALHYIWTNGYGL